MMQTKKRNNNNNNKLTALTLKEFIDKAIEDQDFIYGNQPSSSIVTNPPQNMDMQDDVEDDAENMSIQQIANSIEDSVITDTNSEEMSQQQPITEAEMNEMIEETKQKIKENHPFRHTIALANVLISLEHQGRKRKL